jgi:hypothetical protein
MTEPFQPIANYGLLARLHSFASHGMIVQLGTTWPASEVQ